MSDAEGEYKSDMFDNMLHDQGIKILTSTPHTPQQNGRAERFMRTFMDKAETMHFTACIPQSWWEFSVEYAVQLYNRTPQERLKWSTPFAMLHGGEKPHVDQFRVFGCGAWVLIPQKTRINKLAPKSKLMTYIGQDQFGGIFMHAPNNVIFCSANAQFDETFFPKCPDNKGKKPERSKSPTETHPEPQDNYSDGPKFDNNDAPDNSKRRRTRQHEPSHKRPSNADNGPASSSSSGSGRSSPPQPNWDPVRPQRQAPPEQPLRRSTWVQRPVIRPGNVYGKSRSPHEIIAETRLNAAEESNRGSQRRGVKRLDALTYTAYCLCSN
jgi:hypothetical protein